MTFQIVYKGSPLHALRRDGFCRRSFTPFAGSSVERFETESDAFKVINSSRVFFAGCSIAPVMNEGSK